MAAAGDMLRTIEELALFSVARGCGFAAIGIFTMMIGLIGEPRLALQSGGVLTLIACLVLVMRALHARRQPYKRTEVWLMLQPTERPRQETAQQIIGNALREAYLRFALHAACLSAALLVASVIVGQLPLRP